LIIALENKTHDYNKLLSWNYNDSVTFQK